MLRYVNVPIRPKLILLFLMTGALPLICVGWLSSWLATDSLMDQSFAQLQTTQEIKVSQIENFFQTQKRNLTVLSDALYTKRAFHSLNRFAREHDVSPEGPFPVGNREYKELIGEFAPFFQRAASAYGYHSLFLISADTGQVMYSTVGEDDMGANLRTGRYRASGLARAWLSAIASQETAFTDFRPYGPSFGAESAFMALAIPGDNGTARGVVAIQFSAQAFDSLMNTRQGMGLTGESYLIGSETEDIIEFRSAMRTMGEGTYVIGKAIPSLPYWRKAMEEDQGGYGLFRDSDNKDVLVAYTPLRVLGLDWALISKIDKSEVTAPIDRLIGNIALAGLGLLCVVAIGSFIFSSGVAQPLHQDMEFARAIARGDLSGELTLKRGDELGQLAEALDHMAANLRNLDWLKRGKEGLDDQLRGDLETEDMAQRFIAYLTKHLNAQLGAVFLANEGRTLHLSASYAFTDRKGNFNSIKPGEGLVGQVALERNLVVFSNVDNDAPALNYGVDETTPNHFLVAPLVFKDELLGVFLVGSVRPFPPLKRQFVEQNLENVSVLFNTARSRETIQDLLEQAQEQTLVLHARQEELHEANKELEDQARALRESEQELQAQQEELRVTNEELEEQTKALKESETKLQSQQEELRVTNEELEERTKALEIQKEAIVKKNERLLEAQEEIEQKAWDLELASKYKSEFLANMSHELRTPLNSILILSQMFSANKDGNMTDKQVDQARAIHSSGSDLLSLINEILDLSKVEAGKVELNLEEVPVTRVIADLERIFEGIAQDKGVEFRRPVAEDAPSLLVTDSQRLQQVLRNLLSNAFKFTDTGSVTLSVSRPDADYKPSRKDLNPGKAVVFAVTDTGIGIPKDKQAAVFEAFQQADGTTSRKYGGTGLGLSISRELAKLLGGEIRLSSEEGKGATFSLIIPERRAESPATVRVEVLAGEREPEETEPEETKAELSVEQAATEREEVPSKTPPKSGLPGHIRDDRRSIARGDKVLLIIEDDPNFAKVLVDMAHDRGFKCLMAEDGETGLHFADYYKPSAIVLDIGLPGIDGWAVMERLKSNPDLRHIPVHFMSASDKSLAAMKMGAIGYLTKPVSVESIETALNRIEGVVSRPVKKLLVVEDDDLQRNTIAELIGNGDVVTTLAESGSRALELMQRECFDCMILDLGLRDMTGFELLKKLRNDNACGDIPIIVYTGRDLSREEEAQLKKYAESIIVKGARSPERLLDETTLFLHRVEADLPEEQRKMLQKVHDKESVLDNRKVLLVDDDMRNIFALASVLEEKGMEVVIAKDGEESLEKLMDNPDTNLVLMDIMMPNMDGYEAMKHIRKMDPPLSKVPIIALTAKAMKGDRSKCIEAGANDYLAKPVDTEKLLSVLRVWLYH